MMPHENICQGVSPLLTLTFAERHRLTESRDAAKPCKVRDLDHSGVALSQLRTSAQPVRRSRWPTAEKRHERKT
jgi:hypothetical protein